MAVRLDTDAVRNAVEPALYRDAELLRDSGRLGGLAVVGGGAACTVHGESGPHHEVWVGVVGGGFTAECDCGAVTEPAELCVHAVAVTLRALAEEFAWSPDAVPPSAAMVDPEVRRLAEVAASLPPRRLVALVAEHAATDRRLETRLLTYAGRLGPLTDAELDAARRTVDSLAGDATGGTWQPHDLLDAGRWIVDELEVLAARPAGPGGRAVVEHAARVWDALAAPLYEAGDDAGPEEIGTALRAVHVRICAELRPDPAELAERLIEIVDAAELRSCLDEPEDYLALLGSDGVAALQQR
ncbi:hypothetical protein AB0J86_15080 [Micromonospora sp. NPDC049559]|uniref:hypothetical protein n=1 Tax=Micromonospora sp. NPDC049559 TaxID=3155923 RepID=UPI0034151299